jgi:FkbM family methyltransferase
MKNAAYSGNAPLALSIASLWNKWAPRGKGAFPRLLGRLLASTVNNHYVTTKYGAYLAIDPSSLDVYSYLINNGRTWNEHVFDACRSFLEKGSVFYDIGANIGYMSIEMAKVFEDQVQIISFEPQPSLAHVIALSSKLNRFNNLYVFDSMIGERLGEADLYVGSHSIHASAVARELHSKHLKRTVVTLDFMVDTGCISPPSVIKMDIEGGELSALSGARKTIALYRPHIIFESDVNMERFGYSRLDVIELIKGIAPYDFFFISGKKCELIKLKEENLSLQYNDILAKPL